MEFEIRPDPAEEERAALVAALRAVAAGGPGGYLSPWWREGIEPGDEDGYEATARPRSSRGATRA